jgi:glycosyltransferase involved in cell wall biosynthesis
LGFGVIRIHLVPETPDEGPAWACAEIRLLRPYGHPSLQRFFEVSSGPKLPRGRIDVVILQRGGPVGAGFPEALSIIAESRRRGARILYDIDDDLTCAHPVPEVEAKLESNRPKVRLFIREADAVIASTVRLAERLRRMHPKVFVWENALDDTLIPPYKPPPISGIVGYFGTNSHLRDLLSVCFELATLSIRARNFTRLELCGISDDGRIDRLYRDTLKTRSIPPQGNYAQFHRTLAQTGWSVGLAPLTNTPFNTAKSAIKLLDYAAASIPVVACNAEPYRDFPSGATLLRVEENAFADAVLSLLEDQEKAANLARAAHADLLERHTLRSRASEIYSIVAGVLD